LRLYFLFEKLFYNNNNNDNNNNNIIFKSRNKNKKNCEKVQKVSLKKER